MLKNVSGLYILHILSDFLQTLHESWYWEGVFWEITTEVWPLIVQNCILNKWMDFDKILLFSHALIRSGLG